MQRIIRGRLALLLPIVATLLALLAPAASAQAVQLRDGTVLVGEVIDANSEGLSFRRLDTGGLLELKWEDLSTLFAERIRRAEGLVVEEDSLVTVQADVITFTVAGIKEQVTGIAEWTDEFVKVKRKSGVLPIPRRSISEVGRRPVAALEVYTPAEWYALKLAEIDPNEDADAHIRLADELRRVGMFEQAIVHLEQAEALGGGKQVAQLPAMLRRARVLAEAQEERDLLSQIRVMRNREEFVKAQELVETFQQRFPDSDLERELEREVSRLASARELHLAGRIWQMWDRTVRSVASSYAMSDGNSWAGARSYAEDRMVNDMFERVGGVLDIEAREAQELWSKRVAFGFNRLTLYSYGVGSWLLGEDAVKKDTQVVASAGGGGGAPSAEDRELERLVRKIREAQQRSRQLAQRSGGQGGDPSEEDWWQDASRDDKVAWLRAYFAEYGGQMEIAKAYANPCANCDGNGYNLAIGVAGREEKLRCPVCHGTKYTRAIRAR